MRIPGLMTIVAVVVNSAGCPGLEGGHKPDPSQSQSQSQSQGEKQPLTAPPVGPRYPQGEACRDRALRRVTVRAGITPNLVRIVGESRAGTGFVLASPTSELLIVTNAHVVGGDERITATLTTPSGESLAVADLEVAVDDPPHDLVILRAARTPRAPRGLYVNPAGVRLNQDVVAVGYPAAADPTSSLTFESGKILALNLDVEGRTYLQTNIHIDPSNEGGPVVDACGTVIGALIAIYTDARRVTLIVPAAHVLALHDRYLAPPENPNTRIRTRTAVLEQSLKQKRGDEASEIFSRQFLRENVWGDFLQFLQQAKAQEERYAAEMRKAGMVYADEPFEKRAQFLSGLLPHNQFVAWYVGQAISLHIMSKYEGLHRYLGMAGPAPTVFGGLTSLQVVDVIKESEELAVARVQIVSKRGTKLYDFEWKLESGDWHIARLTCVSGCRRGPP